MQVDPACTAQPCDYRLVDSSDTGAFTVIPDNGGFVISDQSIRAALEQITQDLGPGASEVAATHVRLNPTGESQGVVTSLNVEAAFDVAGQSLTETLALTRSPARQPTSATSP